MGKGAGILSTKIYIKRLVRKVKVAAFIIQYVIGKIVFRLKPRLPKASKLFAQQFPAVPLRPDRLTHLFNFSSELLVMILVIIVAGFNIFSFGLFNTSNATGDGSLVAKLLDYHSDLNPELYAHQNSVRTVVVNRGLISEAFADNTANADEGADSNDDGTAISFNIEENAIVKPNTGSIKGLVNIQVYMSKPGDTLSSIASQFSISTSTVKWANNLSSDTIKPGWYFKIPPQNGVLVQAGSNTTLPDIAKKYSGDLNKIIAYNGLEGPQDLDTDDIIFCPDCSVPAPALAAKPKASSGGSSLPRGKGHIFASGQCTDYVARRYSADGNPIPWGGNAKNWIANSKAFAAKVDKNPTPGHILVTKDNRRYGHVAYIESVNDNQVTFSEWNYDGPFKKTTRTLSISDSSIVGVIHY